MGLILAKTLNGLNAFQRKEASFCWKSSSSLGVIPNFYLGSQLSRIPLILHGLPFSFQPIEAPYIVFHHLLFLFSLMIPFFFKYGYKKGFGCFNLLPYLLAPTFLGILGTVGFKMSWALKRSWSLWVALRKLTFNGHGMMAYLKHGSQLLQGPLCDSSWASLLLLLLHLLYLKAIWRVSRSS